METKHVSFLSELLDFNDFQVWDKYEEMLYAIFKRDFIESTPVFLGKRVQIRKHPMQLHKEQTFFHITSEDTSKNCDPHERIPDLKRCSRIKWIRELIDYCEQNLVTESDSYVKVWAEPYRGNSRHHILCEQERFLVVVEERKDYCLLITSFFIEYDHQLRKKINKYKRFKKAKNALF